MQVESWNRIGSALGCFLKFWAIAASRNSSCARHGLRCTAVKAAIVFLDSVQDEADCSDLALPHEAGGIEEHLNRHVVPLVAMSPAATPMPTSVEAELRARSCPGEFFQ